MNYLEYIEEVAMIVEEILKQISQVLEDLFASNIAPANFSTSE